MVVSSHPHCAIRTTLHSIRSAKNIDCSVASTTVIISIEVSESGSGAPQFDDVPFLMRSISLIVQLSITQLATTLSKTESEHRHVVFVAAHVVADKDDMRHANYDGGFNVSKPFFSAVRPM